MVRYSYIFGEFASTTPKQYAYGGGDSGVGLDENVLIG
jgi:hypothetical protein